MSSPLSLVSSPTTASGPTILSPPTEMSCRASPCPGGRGGRTPPGVGFAQAQQHSSGSAASVWSELPSSVWSLDGCRQGPTTILDAPLAVPLHPLSGFSGLSVDGVLSDDDAPVAGEEWGADSSTYLAAEDNLTDSGSTAGLGMVSDPSLYMLLDPTLGATDSMVPPSSNQYDHDVLPAAAIIPSTTTFCPTCTHPPPAVSDKCCGTDEAPSRGGISPLAGEDVVVSSSAMIPTLVTANRTADNYSPLMLHGVFTVSEEDVLRHRGPGPYVDPVEGLEYTQA